MFIQLLNLTTHSETSFDDSASTHLWRFARPLSVLSVYATVLSLNTGVTHMRGKAAGQT